MLDCGSLDINGNNRFLFQNCEYTGIDLIAGPNVDIVSRIHEFQGGPYDTVISTEAFEHDKFLPRTLRRMIDLLTPDGPLIFTCATTGRPEHGTSAESAWASPGTLDYYRNVPPEEIAEILKAHFKCWCIQVEHADLYGWACDKISRT